jgi:hypothetical protein
MTVLERHWWVRVVVALLAVAAVPLFLVWYLDFALCFDRRMGGIVLVQGALLAAIVVAFLLGIALDATLKALLARSRAVRRASAMHGYQDAMPLAAGGADWAAGSAEAARQVIDVTWPGGWSGLIGEVISVLFIGGAGIYLSGYVLQVILLAAGIHVHVIPDSSSPAPDVSQPPSVTLVILLPFFLGPLAGICSIISPMVDARRYLPARVHVDAEGITRWAVLGGRRTIRWNEARLLEVASARAPWGSNPRPRQVVRYALYGAGTCVCWSDAPETATSALNAITEVALAVAHHARLRSRTFDRALMFSDQSERGPTPRLDRATPSLYSALVMSAGALVFLVLGLTQPCEFVAAVPIVLLCLVTLRRWRTGRPGAQSAPAAPPAASDEPALDIAPGVVYEVPVASAEAFAVNRAAIAILGVAWFLALGGLGALMIVQAVLKVPGYPVVSGGAVAWAVAIFAMSAATGIQILRIYVRASEPVVLADEAGIRQRYLSGGEARIPWDRVTDFRFRQSYGNSGSYRLIRDDGRAIVSWRTTRALRDREPTTPGATSVTPNQMAALIARRLDMPPPGGT